MGLLNAVVSEEALLDTAFDYAARITKNAPLAVRATKRSVIEGLKLNMRDAYRNEAAISKEIFSTEDASSVAVIGLGGVGLAAPMASVVRGAATVIAVDPVPERRELAMTLAATEVVDPADGDVAKQIKALTVCRRGRDA